MIQPMANQGLLNIKQNLWVMRVLLVLILSCLNSSCCGIDDDFCNTASGFSSPCMWYGKCAAVDCQCVATTIGCGASMICQGQGLCSVQGKECAAVNDYDCTGFYNICKKLGRCFAENGICVARLQKDCENSDLCKEFGSCTLQGKACK